MGVTQQSEAKQDLGDQIERYRSRLGSQLLILGHHYQGDDVIRHADHRGDSFRLARIASDARDVPYIVFAGVHFMAESADLLTADDQTVILPDLNAGCSMADMAIEEDVELVWNEVAAVTDARIVPITYINSSAEVKAFVGSRGGAACTSSNAEQVLRWALAKGEKVFFLPDQHLGRNVALRLGIPDDRIVVLDIAHALGGCTPDEIRRAQVLLWKGYCSVHVAYTPEHVAYWRQHLPDARIVVHPECTREVVDLADASGSTAAIIEEVKAAGPGSATVIGTEANLVNRLKNEWPDRSIALLSPFPCLCSTMYRIRPERLLAVLAALDEGRVMNHIRVPDRHRRDARKALFRMLAIS